MCSRYTSMNVKKNLRRIRIKLHSDNSQHRGVVNERHFSSSRSLGNCRAFPISLSAPAPLSGRALGGRSGLNPGTIRLASRNFRESLASYPQTRPRAVWRRNFQAPAYLSTPRALLSRVPCLPSSRLNVRGYFTPTGPKISRVPVDRARTY